MLKIMSGGVQTATVSTSADTMATDGATVPDGANRAEGYVRDASVVVDRSGGTPTATKGEQWDAGDIIILRSADEIRLAKFIRQASTDCVIDWHFYTGT
jgi:hypothetical protein|tara:strand:- start:203 stop:499 length:297 start_codon:yes stop_codon:yes gene_type:complete